MGLLKKTLLYFFFISLSNFQPTHAETGHMIDSVLVKDDSEIIFKGFFEVSRINNINIVKGNSDLENIIIIPYAFINNLIMKQSNYELLP